jgi:hypothetical protein
MTTLFAPEFGTHETRAAGAASGEEDGAGEAARLGLADAADVLDDGERAATEPGEAPTLHELRSATSAKSGANRPMEG